MKEHTVIESKPDHFLDDLLLNSPWPELRSFAETTDLNVADSVVYKHTPYVIILLKVADEWAKTHGGSLPSTREEKKEFKELIRARMRAMDKDNYREAVEASFKVFAPRGIIITNNIQKNAEQSVMNYQSASRNPRPKGFKVKRALQFTLLLVFCIWLLYQIKHSHDNTEDNGRNIQRKLSEEHGASILGRKGNLGLSSGESDSNFEDGGARYDGFDKKTDNSEEESYPKEVASNGGEQDQKEPERKNDNFQIYDNKKSDNEEVSRKENEAIKGSSIVEKMVSVNSSGIDNATISGHSKMEDGGHTFHDENGVPQDVNNNLESMSYEKSDDKKEFLRQNGLLSLNDHNKVNESLHKGEEEVVGSKEGNNVTKGETITMCR
ncbi:unnamed protein product [Camellia sinensis]